jgi:hypothetical protein
MSYLTEQLVKERVADRHRDRPGHHPDPSRSRRRPVRMLRATTGRALVRLGERLAPAPSTSPARHC